MYRGINEQDLIIPDIVDVMVDYVPVQNDLDESVAKAAQLLAISLDIEPIIGEENVQRAIEPQDEMDDKLQSLLIPTTCYFTYSRLVGNFDGSFNDSGFNTDVDKDLIDHMGRQANKWSSIGTASLVKAIKWLEEEGKTNETDLKPEKVTSGIRVFGGRESRASN